MSINLYNYGFNFGASGSSDAWHDPVLDIINFVTSEPAAPTTGDRYINTTTGNSSITTQAMTANYLSEWNGTSWTETAPSEGDHVYDDTSNLVYIYTGAAWAATSNLWQKVGTDLSTVTVGDSVTLLTGSLSTTTGTLTTTSGNISSTSGDISSTSGNILTSTGRAIIGDNSDGIRYIRLEGGSTSADNLQYISLKRNGSYYGFIAATDSSFCLGRSGTLVSGDTDANSKATVVIGATETDILTKLNVKMNAVTNAHYSTLTNAVIEGAEGRVQLIGAEGGSGASSLIFTNAPSSGDNYHWLWNHVPTSHSFELRYNTTAATGTDVYSGSSRRLLIDNLGNIEMTTGTTLTTSVIKAASSAGLSLTEDADILGVFVENGTGDVGIQTSTPSCELQIGTNAAKLQTFSISCDNAADDTAVISLGRSGSYIGFAAATLTGLALGTTGSSISGDADADSKANMMLARSGTTYFYDDVVIGNGAAGIDYTLKFDGEDSDGTITYMEDEARFDFDQSILTSGTISATGATFSGLSDGIVKSATGLLSGGNTVSLTADVSGKLPIANGGTNSSTALNNNRVMVSSGGEIVEGSIDYLTELSLLAGMTAVTKGSGSDNDKLVSQGYVDELVASGSHVSYPSGPTDTGAQGQWSYDSGYMYYCVATDTWVRWAVATTW